jgi:hypothetical protein
LRWPVVPPDVTIPHLSREKRPLTPSIGKVRCCTPSRPDG